ncbi:MAG: aromatic amino acid lyase [Hyphomicrobiaceae bacterium]|nr:MAG: aromatic amino acid lyase [Hyphomicrobiaceae bacterium]
MITVRGAGLTIGDIAAVANGAPVKITDDAAVLARLHASRRRLVEALETDQQIYGVTTLYGGMADYRVPNEKLKELQRVSLWHHKVAAGPRLPTPDVRAAMLLRANSLMKGASGIRLEIIERYVSFLNARATPHVFQRGSIGASGDLSPLAYIGGAITGLDPGFKVDLNGEEMDSHSALTRLGLEPIALEPKEGLALSNGTAASTGVAANCVERAFYLTSLALGVHALYLQALLATSQSFEPFIHAVKSHPGQVWTAETMRTLLASSKLIRDEAAGDRAHRKGTLIQDRYSLRCLPQFVGPIIDGIALAARQIETEANSANDNPLIDPDTGEIFHTGNFLAQYTGIAMDNLRYHLGMLAKHLDVQIALLVTPEFNYGLNPSLTGNMALGINVGLKSLQLSCNALMPLISYHGQSITDRFPTHAEQFNQNINSQAMNAANLARDQLDILEHYLANALVFGVQAVELRSHAVAGSYDARGVLSHPTRSLYLAAREAAGAGLPVGNRPLVWNDTEGFIETKVRGLMNDIAGRGHLYDALADVRESLRRHLI